MLLSLHYRAYSQSVRHTSCLLHEILESVNEIFVPFNPKQPSEDHLRVALLPVLRALSSQIIPVPSANTLALQTFKKNKLPTFRVADQHTDVIVFGSHKALQYV